MPGFSNADASGKWTGIDVDVCRAIAAAVLGDATKVKYTPLSAKDRFEVLKAGDIDVLARNTTWTLSRDGGLALEFPATNFYDGQGFMSHTLAFHRMRTDPSKGCGVNLCHFVSGREAVEANIVSVKMVCGSRL